MNQLNRFRILALRISLGAVAVTGATLSFLDTRIAKGLVLGGLASTLAFWLSARNAERTLVSLDKAKPTVRKWMVVRLAFYALALRTGYQLDPGGLRGFWGAAAGLLMGHLVVRLVGYMGWDFEVGSPNSEFRIQNSEFRR